VFHAEHRLFETVEEYFVISFEVVLVGNKSAAMSKLPENTFNHV